MRKLIIFNFLILISCNMKDPISIKEVVSDEIVTIRPDYQTPVTKDSVPITIPVEFEIAINSQDLRNLNLYFVLINNKRLLDDITDYQIYYKENKTKRIFFSLNTDELTAQKKIHIIVKLRTQMISKNDAQTLLKKYKINKSIVNLNFRDTIKLIGYNQFRKENPRIIQGFQKVNDSVVFSMSLKRGERVHIGQKINW